MKKIITIIFILNSSLIARSKYNTINVLFKIAKNLRADGFYKKVSIVYKKILEIDSGNEKAKLFTAIEILKNNGIENSNNYKKIETITKTLNNPISIALILILKKKYRKAIYLLLEKSNQSFATLFLLAYSYKKEGILDKSLKKYKQILKKYPNEYHILIAITEIYLAKNKHNKAKKILSKIKNIRKYHSSLGF